MLVSIDGQTQLVGLIGWPVAHSLSPEMQNAAFSYVGLNWRYLAFPVRAQDLGTAIRGLASLGIRGVNVTVPYKVDVISLIDTFTEAVGVVGAVNTIRIDLNTGQLEGLNTDMTGFLVDLAANNIRVDSHSHVIILGAGGAARAIAAGLVRTAGHVTIVNRTVSKAESIARFLQSSWAKNNIDAVSYDNLAEISRGATLIVNTTPVGLWPDSETSPWPDDVPFPAEATIYDTVYRPLKTRLMRDAEAAGLRAVGGLGMLVYQGAGSFEVWTGRKAPADIMKMICLQKLNETMTQTPNVP
jgi:shikimate dehydrogenase